MSIFQQGFLAKLETTKYTDSVPTNIANGVRVEKGFAPQPAANKLPYDPVKLTMGALKSMTGRKTLQVEVPMLVRGSGTAGTAPEFGALLQACGLAETLVALTSVSYAPTSTGLKSVTGYCYKDGQLLKALGAVGTATLECTIDAPIAMNVTLSAGFDTTATTTAAPAITVDSIQPIVMTSADVVSDGATINVGSFSLDLGNEIGDHYTTGENGYAVSNRKPTITISKDSVSTVADWNALVAGTEFSISGTFGTVAGNIMTITAAKAVMTSDAVGERNERHIKDITFELIETTGDDQFKIAFT